MKKLVIAIIALLVIGAVGTAVFAGEMKKEGSVMLGYGMPGSDWGDIVDGGIAFGFGYEGYKINDNFSIGGDFIYVSGSGEADILGTSYDFDTTLWGILPYAKYGKEVDMGGTKADLYGKFGLGIYGASVDAGGDEESDSEFGFNIGAGMMFPMGDKMKLGADLTYHLVSSDCTYFIPGVKFTMSF